MIKLLENLDAFSILLGALITGIIGWIIHRWDLRTKKKFMNDELVDKMEVILRLEKETIELIHRFETRDLQTYNSDVFEDLYLDIYESITKDDLYKIYKTTLADLVKVYKKIEFLNGMSLYKIYSSYVDNWDTHRLSSEHSEHWGNHPGDIYCDTHVGLIDKSKVQLQNNLETIKILKKDIVKVLKRKFYWLNPLNNL